MQKQRRYVVRRRLQSVRPAFVYLGDTPDQYSTTQLPERLSDATLFDTAAAAAAGLAEFLSHPRRAGWNPIGFTIRPVLADVETRVVAVEDDAEDYDV